MYGRRKEANMRRAWDPLVARRGPLGAVSLDIRLSSVNIASLGQSPI